MARTGAFPGGARATLRTLIAASMVSKIADWQLGIVVPLAILSQTRSVVLVLFAFALRALPYVASPVLGAVIDRFDKRRALIGAQIEQGLCLLLIVVFQHRPVVVGALLLLAGFGAVIATITGQFVFIPTLFDEAEREHAVSKLASAIEFSKVIGLLLGGAAFSALGPATACVLIAALYFVAGLVCTHLPAVPSERRGISLASNLTVGFHWVRRPEILSLVATMSLANLAVGALETVLLTVFGTAGINTLLVSGLLSAGLLAGAVGSRVGPHLVPSVTSERRILVFQAACFAALFVIALPGLVTKSAGFVAISFALGASNVASITYRQNTIPVELAGRVNAVIRMFITGAIPLSGFLYAGASKLGTELLWGPALLCAALSLAVWARYAVAGSYGEQPESAHATP
jgi:MFS family permease